MPSFTRAAFAVPGRPAGFVNDFANVLQPAERTSLEGKLSAFNASTTIEIAVVTVPSLGGDEIAHASIQIFDAWKIGKAKKDNGVLVLVAPSEHQAWITTGYGLEGALTDLQSSWIVKNVMVPQFKNGNYYAGLNDGVDAIMAAVEGEATIPSDDASKGSAGNWGNFIWLIFFGILSLGRIFAIFLGRTKSWWMGGVLGALGGLVVLLFSSIGAGIAAIVGFALLGLLFDYLVSKSYDRWKDRGGRGGGPWMGGFGGGGGSGGGGFGGFGGGRSGGGGGGGSW
jgi:uncharacterized protein